MPKWLIVVVVGVFCSFAEAADHFLTIGGGETPSNNQVSLEKNVLYLQRFLSDSGLGSVKHDIYFANGKDAARGIQFIDPTTPPPKVNQLVAQVFGQEDNLDASYRAHSITGVKGSASRGAIQLWFTTVGSKLVEGDRLFIYFSGP